MLGWDWWPKKSHTQLFMQNATMSEGTYGYHVPKKFTYMKPNSCAALGVGSDVNELDFF